MKPPNPKNRAGAPGKECARNSDITSQILADYRLERKRKVFEELCKAFMSGSDFAERVRKADSDALRKGKQ